MALHTWLAQAPVAPWLVAQGHKGQAQQGQTNKNKKLVNSSRFVRVILAQGPC